MFTYMRRDLRGRECFEGLIESSRHSSPLQWLLENTRNKGKRDEYNRKTKQKAPPFCPVDIPPPPKKIETINVRQTV